MHHDVVRTHKVNRAPRCAHLEKAGCPLCTRVREILYLLRSILGLLHCSFHDQFLQLWICFVIGCHLGCYVRCDRLHAPSERIRVSHVKQTTHFRSRIRDLQMCDSLCPLSSSTYGGPGRLRATPGDRTNQIVSNDCKCLIPAWYNCCRVLYNLADSSKILLGPR